MKTPAFFDDELQCATLAILSSRNPKFALLSNENQLLDPGATVDGIRIRFSSTKFLLAFSNAFESSNSTAFSLSWAGAKVPVQRTRSISNLLTERNPFPLSKSSLRSPFNFFHREHGESERQQWARLMRSASGSFLLACELVVNHVSADRFFFAHVSKNTIERDAREDNDCSNRTTSYRSLFSKMRFT